MPVSDLILDLSPTQTKFVYAQEDIVQLIGPMGEGKTHAGVAGLIVQAQQIGITLHAALIRDTHENIKTSTVISIQEILRDWVVFKNDYKKMIIRTTPAVECDLFGIDDPASVSKLQGPPYGCIWLEEPAPVHEKANAGLPQEVFFMAIARCARQTGSRGRLQITHNPGDEDHWTTELMDDPYEYMVADDGTIVTKITYNIPRGENKHLTSKQRALNQAAFKKDKGKWARYVEGNVAMVGEGKPVTPPYNPLIHFSQKILPVYPGVQGYRGWDGYGHPCSGVAQFNPAGQFVIHDVLYEEGVGVEELIEDKLLPLLNTPKYKDKIRSWRDIGDPSMAVMDQSSRKRSAARVIGKMLNTRFERGPTRWKNRIEPLNRALRLNTPNGAPQIILSASAAPLNRALRGGWHFKTDNSGNILGTEPVKDKHSHPGDMLAYLIAEVFPYQPERKGKPRDREAEMRRVASYATGGMSRPGTLPAQYRGPVY